MSGEGESPMAEVEVVRQEPVKPPIEKVVLTLTPEEAAIVYFLVGTKSQNAINEELRNRGVEIQDTGQLSSIYAALNPYAKTSLSFL